MTESKLVTNLHALQTKGNKRDGNMYYTLTVEPRTIFACHIPTSWTELIDKL